MNKFKKMIDKVTNGIQDNKMTTFFNNLHITPSFNFHMWKPSRLFETRIIQNFILVWLDGNIDPVNNQDTVNTIIYLRKVVNHINTFTDIDQCIDFITDIEEEEIFVICSGEYGQRIAFVLQEVPQISSIYIFCGNKTYHEQWVNQWTKIKGVFTEIKPICKALEQSAEACDQNTISMSFVAPTSVTANQNLNQLDHSFMYTQILKEILLTIDFQPQHIDDFILYCQAHFSDNHTELKNVVKLENEYHKHNPIWWYTYPCFLYSMLNRALRTMETDLIISMGFLLRDLHEHIVRLHSKQYTKRNRSKNFMVYRGQGLSETDFMRIRQIQGGLLSFNNFLSTSAERQISLDFACETIRTTSLIGIVFMIKINPSVASTPFANVHDVSYCRNEKEILFSMHSVFRVGEIKRLKENNRLWQVELTLTSDNDPQLHALTERIREETFAGFGGWHRLGHLLIKLGQFDKSEQVYDMMLKQATDDHERLFICHMLGMVKDSQGEYSQALEYYERSLELKQMYFSPTNINLAASYNNIGLIYEKLKEYSKALSNHKKALDIRKNVLPENHPSLAESYACHGSLYDSIGDYPASLSYYVQAHKIYQAVLPEYHPDMATSFDNQGKVLSKIAKYSEALKYQQKALDIRQQILPANHPNLAISCNNIGSIYRKMGDYSKALSFYERALSIGQRSLSGNHPHLQLYREKVESMKEAISNDSFIVTRL